LEIKPVYISRIVREKRRAVRGHPFQRPILLDLSIQDIIPFMRLIPAPDSAGYYEPYKPSRPEAVGSNHGVINLKNHM
jgi:hypothetical protein